MKNRNDLTKTESRRLCLFLLHLAIAAGIVIGAFIVSAKKMADVSGMWWLHQYFAPVYSGNTVLAVFRNTFLSSELFLIISLLLGFFAVGQPLDIALLIYKGIGIGASVAVMYLIFGIGSLPSVLILILPKALMLSYISVLGVRESLKISVVQLMFLFKDEPVEEKMGRTVKLYFIKFLVLSVIVAFISAMDSLANYFFMDLY